MRRFFTWLMTLRCQEIIKMQKKMQLLLDRHLALQDDHIKLLKESIALHEKLLALTPRISL